MENMPLNEQQSAENVATPAKQNKFTQIKGRLLSEKRRSLIDTYGYLWLAAAIPALIMFLIYLVRGLYPFGDGSVLVLDLNGQYVYFYEALRDFIYGDGSLLYSFSRALGGEFLGIYDYYIASPFSWLVALFPKDRMLEALLFIFILKSAISGFTMGFYLHKHSAKVNKLAIITFSIMYAMSSYAVIQQHNSMWIDALMWLPLLTYGIEELIKKGHFRLFTTILAITLISNFYIGYMVCIYTVIYSFYYYFAHNENNENNPFGEKNHFVRSVLRMGGWALLAIGIAALTVLSARYALSFGKNEFSNPDWSINQKFNLFEFLYKLLPSSYDTVRPAGLPFVYCGVLTVIMVPAYFMSKKFSNRKKVAAALLIVFFIASFAVSPLDLIWHGFQKPNWLNYRYSFMLCFILISLAYKAFEHIEFFSRKALLGVVAFIGLYTLLLQELGDYITGLNEKMVISPWGTVGLTLFCLLVYFIIICLMGRSKKKNKELLVTVLAFIVCAEVFTSALCDVNKFDEDVSYSSYSKYNNFLDTFRPIVDTIEENDKSFYRTEKTYHKKTNDSMALGTKGLSLSTSTLNRDTIVYLQKMGYSSKSHWSKYFGGNPVNDSLLGVKYIISNYDFSDYYGDPLYTKEDYGYSEDVTLTGTYDVYLNEYALSLAYGVAEDYGDFKMTDYDTPFERLNALVAAMLGEDEPVQIFVPAVMSEDITLNNMKHEHIDASRTADKIDEEKYLPEDKEKAASLTYTFTVPTDTMLYYYNPTGYNRQVKLKANSLTKEPITGLTLAFGGNETTRMIYLGESTKEQLSLTITIDNDSKNFYTRKKDSYVYYLDMDVFKDAIERLAKTQLVINEDYTDDNLTGSVKTLKDDQLMYTSIPYDEGWNVYVDDKEVDIFETSDALISFRIDKAGEHDIRLQYMPAEIMLGIIVTSVSTVLFIAILAAYPFIKKIKLFKKTVLIDGEELPKLPTDEELTPMARGDIGYLDDDEADEPKKHSFTGDSDKGKSRKK
ncbi:MAG: YfhO family protein [Clostridia bacterium]|nr:YfhO family protein [Clostridia bacterium]